MNGLTIFKNKKFGEIRTVLKNNEVWFVLNDVCNILEISNSRNIKSRLEDDDVHSMDIIDSLGRMQNTTIINEFALYECVLLSRKSEAKKFKYWITHEVIPQIRKKGYYSLVPKNYAESLRALADSFEENKKLLEENETLETALNISLEYCTVAKYNKQNNKGWDMKQCQKIGKNMKSFCIGKGYKFKKCFTNDERFSYTYSYPMKAWNEYFENNLLER